MTRHYFVVFLHVLCIIQEVANKTTTQLEASVISKGDTITLSCEGSGSSHVWYKKQRDNKEVDIGIILSGKQYITHNQYKSRTDKSIETSESTGFKKFILSINDAIYEDSGDYACENPKTNPKTWHKLTVIKPLANLEMSTTSEDGQIKRLVDGSTLPVTESSKFTLICSANGSNPSADLRITIDEDDLTDSFKASVLGPMDSSIEDDAMSNLTYNVEARGPFPVDKKNNGEWLTCEATVSTLPKKKMSVQVIYEMAPTIHCRPRNPRVSNGTHNFQMRCRIEAQPKPNVYVKCPQSVDYLQPGNASDQYAVLMEEGDDGMWMLTVTVKQITEESFGNYIIIATNKHGAINETMLLVEGDLESNASTTLGPVGIVTIFLSMATILNEGFKMNGNQ